MGGPQLADLGGGLGAGLDGGADAADVAADHHADDAAVELDDRAGQLDARRLEHRIDRIDQPDQAHGLDQAQRISVHGRRLPSLRSFGSHVCVMGASAQERLEDGLVGPGDDVGADQLADPAGGLGAGLDGRADAADVAPDQRGDEAAADLHAAGQVDVGRLEHRVGRLDHADQALGLDQAEGLAVACRCRDSSFVKPTV